MIKERSSLIFVLIAMFLSFQITLRFASAPVAWAILESISGPDLSSVTMAPRYLKLWTVSSFRHWPWWYCWCRWCYWSSAWSSLHWSACHKLLRSCQVAPPSSVSVPASPSMSSAKCKFVIVLPPMLTVPAWSSSASVMILSRRILKRVGESRQPCLSPTEIWGTTNIHVIETAHLFACKRFLNVSDKTPNNMIYGETSRYPLLIDSAIRSLRYWLKITNMPLNRFPRQSYTMLRNDVEATLQNNQSTGLHNWAKECLEAYGLHDVWLNGRVADKSAFLSSFKNRITGRFREEWYSKISTSDRFSTYQAFKVTDQKEIYLDSITVKKFRDALIKLRLGICEIGVNKR